MEKIFCLMGKSASGKNTIFNRLAADDALGLKHVIPYTTRPVRTGEEDGREYFFVNNGRYEEMCRKGLVIESRTYDTVLGPWHYFTADDGQIDLGKNSAVIIGTLEAYEGFCSYFGKENVVPVYIEADDGERLSRALKRERKQQEPNYAEMCRRYLADREDFSDEKLEEAGIRRRYVNNDADECYNEIKKDIIRMKG